MIKIERERTIIELLERKKVLTLKELSEVLNQSESTIRRDLVSLEKQGKLKRVHGGASLVSKSFEIDLESKSKQNNKAKEDIAKFASYYIGKNQCVFLDAGSTVGYIIKYLKDKSVTVVTNGIHHASELSKYNIKTYLTGGNLKHKTGALIGREALKTIENYNYDISFLGTNGIDLKGGLTTPDPEEASIKEKIISKSKKTIVLADESKFSHVLFAKFGNIKDLSIVTNNINLKEYQDIETIINIKKESRK